MIYLGRRNDNGFATSQFDKKFWVSESSLLDKAAFLNKNGVFVEGRELINFDPDQIRPFYFDNLQHVLLALYRCYKSGYKTRADWLFSEFKKRRHE